MSETSELLNDRFKKYEAIKMLGNNPFGGRFDKSALISSLVEGYEEKKMVMYDIIVNKNKRTISEKPTSESDNFVGSFAELLPPKNVKIPQQLRDDVIEELKKAGIQIHKKIYSNETLN